MKRLPFAFVLVWASVVSAEPGAWDMEALRKTPPVVWNDADGPIRRLYYEGEPRNGKPTRIFAFLAKPAKVEGKLPAVVLVHGGGGKAFVEWAKLWADRGYVALAMDLAGKGPDGIRLPDGGPNQGDVEKFPVGRTDLKDIWSHHAVAAVIRGVSLVRSLPEVDPEKVAVTGISWGGYLTCIVAGMDDRIKAAVPVYGCGFLHENSVWLPKFAAMPEDWRNEWIAAFDPSKHLARAKMPVLFVNGTNDFAYPLDSYMKSCRLVKDRTLCVTVNMPHGHPQGWAPKEIGLFIDKHLKGGEGLATIGAEPKIDETAKTVSVEFRSDKPKAAALHWTSDTGAWKERKWKTAAASLAGGKLIAELPAERPAVLFLTLTDQRGATVSTETAVLEKK